MEEDLVIAEKQGASHSPPPFDLGIERKAKV